MAKSNLEKAIEKQQKEAKRQAEQDARRQRASTIINGQPMVDGMRIMDAAACLLYTSVSVFVYIIPIIYIDVVRLHIFNDIRNTCISEIFLIR